MIQCERKTFFVSQKIFAFYATKKMKNYSFKTIYIHAYPKTIFYIVCLLQ